MDRQGGCANHHAYGHTGHVCIAIRESKEQQRTPDQAGPQCHRPIACNPHVGRGKWPTETQSPKDRPSARGEVAQAIARQHRRDRRAHRRYQQPRPRIEQEEGHGQQ